MRRGVGPFVLFAGLAISGCAPAPLMDAKAPRYAFWYWNREVELGDAYWKTAAALGAKEVFARCGSVDMSEGVPHHILSPDWKETSQEADCHLVLRLESDVVREFEKLDLDVLTKTVSDAFDSEEKAAESAGFKVAGWQVDFDCPTRLLPRYGQLLKGVRANLPKGLELSVGALPTWFYERKEGSLKPYVDFVAAELYEGAYGKTPDTYLPIASEKQTQQGLKALERSGIPYWAGVSTYGRALEYGPDGQIDRILADQAPSDLLAHIRGDIYEDRKGLTNLVKFPYTESDGSKGTVICDIPTERGLRAQIQIIKDAAPRHCLGILVFRYPEEGEEYALSSTEIERAVNGGTATLSPPTVRLSGLSNPYSVIETGDMSLMQKGVTIEVQNPSDIRTDYGPEAAGISILLKPGQKMADVSSLDGSGYSTTSHDEASSLARADKVTFAWPCIGPHEKKSVQISWDGPVTGSLTVKSWAVDPDGKRVEKTWEVKTGE